MRPAWGLAQAIIRRDEVLSASYLLPLQTQAAYLHSGLPDACFQELMNCGVDYPERSSRPLVLTCALLGWLHIDIPHGLFGLV
jgi:hypothetical protein